MFSASGTTLSGPLCKWTNIMQGWQYRIFVLDSPTGVLSYYTSKEKLQQNQKRGMIKLKHAFIGLDNEDDCTFTITSNNKTFHFQAANFDDRARWVGALENTIKLHAFNLVSDFFPLNLRNPLANFDQSLHEADSYLEILIDQTNDLRRRCGDLVDVDGRAKLLEIVKASENVIECVKRNIVLLQIAKSKEHGGLSDDHRQDDVAFSTRLATDFSPQQTKEHSPASSRSSDASDSEYMSATDDEEVVAANADPLSERSPRRTSPPRSPNKLNGTPLVGNGRARSRSSEVERPAPSSAGLSWDYDDPLSPLPGYTGANSDFQPPPIPKLKSIDYYDALHDEVDSQDLGSVNKYGSVLRHLMGQISIGMDLTKVVLPTFILERRSFLEFLADFFAHPDIFVNIPLKKTPKERFVEVVRFYLSSFHAGRRSPIAKKPYNPIIGEMFRCYYDIPGMGNVDTNTPNPDCPVPWASAKSLSFVAEQVSHHPPVSAFYAECEDRNISFNGYIWTKSKFLGLSIAVHMVGEGVISLIDHKENYIVTFPSGYARSILTTPWLELGGKPQIRCEETNYSAQIEFHTKQFYSREINRISAKLFEPNGNQFATISGVWTGGKMFVQWAGSSTTEAFEEEIFDTETMPTYPKRCQPMEYQFPHESRRLWHDVTVGLKELDHTKATDAKQRLEQHQREGEKRRKAVNQKFKNRLFNEVGQHWVYQRSLVKRRRQVDGSARPLQAGPL